jgi:hypothetical protein
MLGASGPLAACAARGATSTRLTGDDLSEFAARTAQAMQESDAFKLRDESSPRMVIAISRVENLTNDLIPRREQWAMMARVRDSGAMVNLGRRKNFALVIPAEHLEEGLRTGVLEPGTGDLRAPTHEMTGTLLSATRSGAASGVRARTDAYVCEFRLTDLASGELVWSDGFEIKRAAMGRSFD